LKSGVKSTLKHLYNLIADETTDMEMAPAKYQSETDVALTSLIP